MQVLVRVSSLVHGNLGGYLEHVLNPSDQIKHFASPSLVSIIEFSLRITSSVTDKNDISWADEELSPA